MKWNVPFPSTPSTRAIWLLVQLFVQPSTSGCPHRFIRMIKPDDERKLGLGLLHGEQPFCYVSKK